MKSYPGNKPYYYQALMKELREAIMTQSLAQSTSRFYDQRAALADN